MARKKKEVVNDEVKIDVSTIEAVKMYDFQFNDKIKDISLRNKKVRVTGELASNFIAKGYGILC